ncbi:hypothetical protein H4R21_003246 [Coemansia helicoidea]|uniref:Uncharacterized protein n=1 Tax=Coemansia helicoidea TaxID=1286919 RepID=A0ACC1L326_9FUNG|nr:hypothetical protein H4R21_003246 [Coemansia helicoidea]
MAATAASAKRRQCPRCASRVEPFAVDTNCTFSMCANVGCAWPFDSADMGNCFEQDATVPSIRKLAKKRKSVALREERRTKRQQSVAQQSSRSSPAAAALAALKAPAVPLVPVAAAGGVGNLSDWLADLCDSAAADAASAPSASCSTALLGDYLRLPANPEATGPLLMSQGNYPPQREGEAGSDAVPSAEWLDSLLAGAGDLSARTPPAGFPAGLTPTPLDAANAGGSAAPTARDMTDDNVADLLAALTSASAPSGTVALAPFADDAVIPRVSRHPSPSSSNTDSAADTDSAAPGAHPPLSPDDLERLIGRSVGDAATAHGSVAPVCVKAHSADASYLDSLTMLLSPPHSASPAISADGPPAKPVALSLLDPRFWSSHSSAAASLSLPATASPIGAARSADAAGAAHHASFDLNDLFREPKAAATAAASSALSPSSLAASADCAASQALAASPIDTTSIIENIFGAQPRLTSDSL